MRSYVTSYNGLFAHCPPDAPAVERIEIPLIQRDYAQGRVADTVERIRTNFLNVLHEAVTDGNRVSLDFVYGDVEGGTLRPLDGQQRLTTLFLLHWYLAYRADRMGQEQGWKHFTYATRASARLFCERLVEFQPSSGVESLASWIEDQPWYLHTWQHDPTIQSMLVMLDAIHERFRDDDGLAAWKRLVDEHEPAISFHLLPIEQMGLSEDLYIKMNSRGMPLTPFENFKARFEQLLETSCTDRVKEFALKVDGRWSDLLWPYRGSDCIVDDEFLRYFQFVTELCEWREGRSATGDIASRAEEVYGRSNLQAASHLSFLIQAFDIWVDTDIKSVFVALFAASPPPLGSDDVGRVVVFGQQGTVDVDLFAGCCESYGDMRGQNRVFGWPNTIFLYAVLLHRIHNTPDFPRRLRVLRNVVEASNNELRLDRMPALLADVDRIVLDGTLDGVAAFNQAQVADERMKADMLVKCPDLQQALFELEDHPVLRGCIAAFELDPAVFEKRALAFHQLFAESCNLPHLTGALLAVGDYARRTSTSVFQFGSGSNLAPWRELLTGVGRSHLAKTREILGRLLDAVAQSDESVPKALEDIQQAWLGATVENDGLEWRWYLLRYPTMREGRSGLYVGSNGALGYSVCMLNKSRMNSYYRDPYLLAIQRMSGVESSVEDPWFTGYETVPRWLELKKSGVGLQSVQDGLLLRAPSNACHAEAFQRICDAHGVGEDRLLRVQQVERDGRWLDVTDRVMLGAALLRDLVTAGL
jgi:hypothetical protein